MKKYLLFLSAAVFLAISCENDDNSIVKEESQLSNLTFTTCNQDKDAGNVSVQFTNTGIHITHNGLPVTCDFDTVLVSYTFINGVLRITEQGSPSDARCICYTDVSYTINGIQQSNVNVIFVNGEQVWCHNQPTTRDDRFLPFCTDSTKTLDSVYLVNTQAELEQQITFVEPAMGIPFFDLTNYSFLFLYSMHTSGVSEIRSTVLVAESLPEQVMWNVNVHSNVATVITPYIYIKRIGKIHSNATVTLNKQIIYEYSAD